MIDKGFIMLSRKFFSHEMWEAARTFSECEAWIDLIQLARFEATDKTECIGGREICYGRGQYPASIRFLARKWQWGEQKVKSFLSKLKRKGMIATDCSQGTTVITLVKYNEYNSFPSSPATTSNEAKALDESELDRLITRRLTQLAGQWQPGGNPNTNKEEKGEEEMTDRREAPPEIPPVTGDVATAGKQAAARAAALQRKDEFYNCLAGYVGRYPKEMLRAFFNYWSEMNRSETKMRYELQKTWQLAGRLATWSAKEKVHNRSNFASHDNTKQYTDF